MPWWSGFLFLAVVFLNNGVIQSQNQPSSQRWPNENGQPFYNQPSNSNIDIQFDNEPMELISAGSGHGRFPTDDEDFDASGSGSGSGFGDIDDEAPVTSTTTTTTTTTPTTPAARRPLSNCERDQQRNKVLNKKGPDCLRNGDYASLQCMDLPGTADCWCVDLNNDEIHGTRMEAPNIPSCDDGDNLSPCLFALVKAYRPHRLGSFIPKCTFDGQYHKQQCHGSVCYCVEEETGKKITGTEVSRNARPVCEEKVPIKPEIKYEGDTETEDLKPVETDDDDDEVIDPIFKETDEPEETGNEGGFPDDGDMNIDIGKGDGKTEAKQPEDTNETGQASEPEIKKDSEGYRSSMETAGEIMTQPGILAGIIGGSVVLLLCLVLLIMFIVYRMRKKDEGSYPLDEPRRPANYAYVRTPDKEFYA